uniref:Uncharacterized protein n=1 Tax=Romanomermis culicivorax TaxID=13658 RepID=A0A915HW47_ROMCU
MGVAAAHPRAQIVEFRTLICSHKVDQLCYKILHQIALAFHSQVVRSYIVVKIKMITKSIFLIVSSLMCSVVISSQLCIFDDSRRMLGATAIMAADFFVVVHKNMVKRSSFVLDPDRVEFANQEYKRHGKDY